MEEEIWKPIKGYEGLYEMSNLGKVKSLEQYIQHQLDFDTIRVKVDKLPLLQMKVNKEFNKNKE